MEEGMRNKRFLRTICLLALTILLKTVPAAGEAVTRCLLIGCDRFVSMRSTEPVSANNTETMAGLLADFLPVSPEITRLVNGPGTAAGLEELAEEVFRGMTEEDTALIYLSTHGVMQPRNGSFQMALLLSDGTDEEALEPERLHQIMDRIPGKKILIVDACHSGAVIGAGGENGTNLFENGNYRVLTSSSAEEDSWFWSAKTDNFSGTGYFTAALESALRASDPEQIDPDGDGEVSLEELTGRLREIYAVSTVCCWPAESREPMFRLPEDRKAGERLRGLSFGRTERSGESVVLPIRFRAEEQVRVMYQLIFSREGRWDFEHAVRLPDREKTGLIRGMLSPGEKERTIRLSLESLGEDGKALLQIISLRGEEQTPAVEAGRVIAPDLKEGNLPDRQEIPEDK